MKLGLATAEPRQGGCASCGSFPGSPHKNFEHFLESREFSDVEVTLGDDPKTWNLHSLLLASCSEFFHKALTSSFTEGRERRIHIECSFHQAWPLLVSYFYTNSLQLNESDVLPLLALSRQLLVPDVEAACMVFVQERLAPATSLSFLRGAVQYNLPDLQDNCITLAARGLYFLYDGDVAGLPPHIVVEILQHKDLLVHCELQVLEFVLKYLTSTQVDDQGIRDICTQIRFPFLDNDTLTSLAAQGILPRDVVLEGALARMALLDKPAEEIQSASCLPRHSYCCNRRYNLPGGCAFLDVDLETIWEQLVKCMGVKASSVAEGDALNVLSAEPDAWFETQCSPDPPSWIEVTLPANVKIISLSRYTYCHGHRRAGYYRLRNFKTQVSERPGAPWHDIPARNLVEKNEVLVAAMPGIEAAAAPRGSAAQHPMQAVVQGQGQGQGQGQVAFQVLRVLLTGAQEDGVHRLCMRNLRLYGMARVGLMAHAPGKNFIMQPNAAVPGGPHCGSAAGPGDSRSGHQSAGGQGAGSAGSSSAPAPPGQVGDAAAADLADTPLLRLDAAGIESALRLLQMPDALDAGALGDPGGMESAEVTSNTGGEAGQRPAPRSLVPIPLAGQVGRSVPAGLGGPEEQTLPARHDGSRPWTGEGAAQAVGDGPSASVFKQAAGQLAPAAVGIAVQAGHEHLPRAVQAALMPAAGAETSSTATATIVTSAATAMRLSGQGCGFGLGYRDRLSFCVLD